MVSLFVWYVFFFSIPLGISVSILFFLSLFSSFYFGWYTMRVCHISYYVNEKTTVNYDVWIDLFGVHVKNEYAGNWFYWISHMYFCFMLIRSAFHSFCKSHHWITYRWSSLNEIWPSNCEVRTTTVSFLKYSIQCVWFNICCSFHAFRNFVFLLFSTRPQNE